MRYLPLALILLALPSCDHKKETAKQTTPPAREEATRPPDRNFMIEAAQANNAEVDAGRLAIAKTENATVKDYARNMVVDHQAANMELREIARTKDFRIPETPDQTHLKKLAQMGTYNGAEFDRHFMAMMVEDHIQAVRLFESASAHAKEGDVRTWAAKMLPKLESHLKQAREVNSKVTATTP